MTLSQFLLKHGIELLQWEQGLLALVAASGLVPVRYLPYLMLLNVGLTYTIDFINKRKEIAK